MASNVNSRGVPVDQDGEPLEYGVIGGAVAPFAVRSDVFRELFMEHKNQRNSHLETEPLGPVERPSVADLPSGSWSRSSLVGGIPIERVEIEDVDEGGKGFTEEQVIAQSQLEGFGSKPPVRDEYGLPVIQPSGGKVPPTSDPFKDKMKGKVEDKGPDLGADGVFDKKSEKKSEKHWVRKSEVVQPQPDAGISTPTAGVPTVEKGEVPDHPPSQVVCEDGSIKGKADHESGWTEIKRKKDVVTMDTSPSPPVTFKNLKNVDEIDKRKGALAGTFGGKRLTKSQKKRLRLQGSSSSPNSTT
ncbi:hypothetical protein ACET3Z_021328 [Daucus carota]